MPLNIALEAINAIITLLRLSLIVSIPAFVVVLAGERIHKYLSERFSLSWAKSTLISTYIILSLLIMVLYSIPLYLGWAESPLTGQQAPASLQPILLDFVLGIVFFAAKIMLNALILTIFALPLQFFGVYILETIAEKQKLPPITNKFLAVFATALLVWIIILFLFPWIWGGLFYLLFWS